MSRQPPIPPIHLLPEGAGIDEVTEAARELMQPAYACEERVASDIRDLQRNVASDTGAELIVP